MSEQTEQHPDEDDAPEQEAKPAPYGMVTLAAHKRLERQRREAQEEATRLRAEIDTERAARVRIEAEWQTERAVWQVGITDPEAIEVAKVLHGKIPEKDRPPLSDWLRGLKEDPSKAPRALSAYLTPPEAKAADPKPAPKGAAPASSTTTTSGAASQLSAEQIRSIYSQAQRTGNWSEWEQVMGRRK